MNLSRALPPPVDDRLLAGPYTNPVAVAELVRTSYALRHMLACTVGEETVTAILSGDSEPAPDGVDARQLAWNLWWFELADFADLFTAWWRCGPDYLRGWHFPTVLTGYARGGPSKEALDAAGIGAATTDAANRRALDLRRETGVGATLEGIGMFAADDAGPDFDLASPASLCALFDSLATADALKAERAAAVVWPLSPPTLMQNAVLASPRLRYFPDTDASDPLRRKYSCPRPQPWTRWQRTLNAVVKPRRPARPTHPAPR